MPERLTLQFIKFLRSRGYLITRQRRKIAETVFSTPGHFSVEDIHDLLQRNKVSASKPSIYRTLDVLIKSGLVVQYRIGRRFNRFIIVRHDQHYDHLICTKCGKVMEFKNDTIEEQWSQVAKDHGFVITNPRLEIFGFCKKCRVKWPSVNQAAISLGHP